MYDEETLDHNVYGSLYSNGSYFKYPLFYNRNYEYSLFEYIGRIYLYKIKKRNSYQQKAIRVLSTNDLNTLKSCALNSGYKVDWDNFSLAHEILRRQESSGYPLNQNLDHCKREKVKEFMEI